MGSGTSVGGRMLAIFFDGPNKNLPANSVAFLIAFCASVLSVFVGAAFGDEAKFTCSFHLMGAVGDVWGSSISVRVLLERFVVSLAAGSGVVFPLLVVCGFLCVCGLEGLGLFEKQGPAKVCNLLFCPFKNFPPGMSLRICRTH